MKGVEKGKQHPPRVVLYGPPKIGKSTFGAEAPKPIFVPTEDGIDAVEVDRFQRPATWTDFLATIERVATEAHEYKTLVVDTINGAAELAAAHVCESKFGGDWGPRGFGSFGQGAAATSEEVRRLLPLLDRCRVKGMTILLLAHSGTQRVPNPLDADFSKWVPDVDRRIWARIAAWADVIGRAEYQHTVLKDAVGKAKAMGASVRVVRFAGSAAEDVGTRVGYNLPATLPLSYQVFAEALGGKNGSNGKGVVAEIQGLWGLLSAEETKSTLDWLGVSDLSKATPAKLNQLVNRLRQVRAERDKETENA